MAPIRKYLKPGQKVVLLLTAEECGLITSLTYIPEELMQAIYSSKCRDEIVSARFTLSELEEPARVKIVVASFMPPTFEYGHPPNGS